MSTKYVDIMHNASIFFIGVRDDFFTCACKQTDLEDDIKKVSIMNRTHNILMFFFLLLHILSLTCVCKQTDLEDDIEKVSIMNRNIIYYCFFLLLHILSLTCACKQTDLEDAIQKVSTMNRKHNIILMFFSLVAHSLFDMRM
jgi:hypothetical protein